jgi:streptogramin lyase
MRRATILAAAALYGLCAVASARADFQEFPTGPGTCPSQLTVGPDAKLWFIDRCRQGVARMSTAGTLEQIDLGLEGPFDLVGIAANPTGIYLSDAKSNQLIKYQDDTATTNQGTAAPSSCPPPSADGFKFACYRRPGGVLWTAQPGPDGAVWFGSDTYVSPRSSNEICSVRPTLLDQVCGAFEDREEESVVPDVELGPDGNVWFTDRRHNRLGLVPTDCGARPPGPGCKPPHLYSTGLATDPYMLTPGPDGAMWFTGYASNRIGRVAVADGAIASGTVPTPFSGPSGIVAGPDKAIWFTEYEGGKLGRLTLDGRLTEFPLPSRNSHPRGVVVGPDGALWVAEEGDTSAQGGRLAKFTPPPGQDGKPGAGGKDIIPPAFSGLSVAPRRFRARRARASASTGTTFRFRLSEPGAVKLAIARRARCRVPGRPRRTRVCFPFVGSLRAKGRAGANNVHFTGRFGRRILVAGGYRLVAEATDAAGNRGRAKPVSFTVLAGR